MGNSNTSFRFSRTSMKIKLYKKVKLVFILIYTQNLILPSILKIMMGSTLKTPYLKNQEYAMPNRYAFSLCFAYQPLNCTKNSYVASLTIDSFPHSQYFE